MYCHQRSQYIRPNSKKNSFRPQKLLIIGPKLFQVLARLPKPAQNWFFINMSQDPSVSLSVLATLRYLWYILCSLWVWKACCFSGYLLESLEESLEESLGGSLKEPDSLEDSLKESLGGPLEGPLLGNEFFLLLPFILWRFFLVFRSSFIIVSSIFASTPEELSETFSSGITAPAPAPVLSLRFTKEPVGRKCTIIWIQIIMGKIISLVRTVVRNLFLLSTNGMSN